MAQEKNNKTLNLLKLILEIVWGIVSLIALAIAVKETISGGLRNNLLYYLFFIIAVFFYFSRRKQRKTI